MKEKIELKSKGRSFDLANTGMGQFAVTNQLTLSIILLCEMFVDSQILLFSLHQA